MQPLQAQIYHGSLTREENCECDHFMSSVFLEPAVFLALAPYLSRRCLQVCGQSCRQSFDLAYASDVWQVIDFSQWQPLEGHVEPGDADLILALKRVPMGRVRRLVLQSGRISNEGLQKILMMQSQLEELLIGHLHLGHDSAVDLPKLRRLELLPTGSPGMIPMARMARMGEVKELGMQIAKNLETLVLHLPTLRDLQAFDWFRLIGWLFKGYLCKGNIFCFLKAKLCIPPPKKKQTMRDCSKL